MGKKSRDKGNRAERLLARKLAKWWGADFTRTPSSGGFRTKAFRDDWNAAGDLVTPDDSFPFCVESKHVEGWHLEQLLTAPKCDIIQWWNQTIEETPDGKIPLLIFTKNYHPHLFMIPLKEWKKVIRGRKDLHGTPTFKINGMLVKLGLLDELFKTKPDRWRNSQKA